MPASGWRAAGVLLAAALLAGCWGAGGQADPSEAGQRADEAADGTDAVGPSASGAEDADTGEGDGGIAGHEADPVPSTAERSGQGDYPLFDGERDEYLFAVGECLQAAGWPVEVSADGSMLSLDDVGGEQRLLLREAREQCRYEVGVLPPLERLDDADLSRLYDRLREAKACLEAEGVTVSEPPSREAFIEGYHDGGGWSPHGGLAVDQAEWERLNEVCPQATLD